jgi:IS30 family transposase
MTIMNPSFQEILEGLPPKPPRSKLDPYAELIRELRNRSRSYREIASILKDRCDLSVGVHTLYSFVRTRNLGAAALASSASQNQNIGNRQRPDKPLRRRRDQRADD